MTAECPARAQASFSFSVTCQIAHPYRRDSSAPFIVRRGAAPPFPFALAYARERSAKRRTFSSLHLAVPRAVLPARAPPGAPPRRFFTPSPCFFDRTGGTSPHVIQAALAPPFIRSRPAIKGSALIGCGR